MSVSVLVMGLTKTGKSTLINALIGESLLPARATSGTALVTEIGYGNDTEHIKVFYKDSDTIVIMPKERYAEGFIYPEECGYDSPWEKWEKTHKKWMDMQAGIPCIEIKTNNPFFPSGFRIIDTPGLSYDNYHCDWYYNNRVVTNEYLPKADAIVFMLNAYAFFSNEEIKYIEKNFAGKHLQNAFFVVNRTNQVTEPLEETVKPAVKSGLSNVFTDASGKFDEKLFQKRVFYVDAYGALCARTGEPYTVVFGKKKMEVSIAIEETGFPEFESALWQYLRSCVGYGRK